MISASPLPLDHAARVSRLLTSLAGLSVGDAFGQQFFGPAGFAHSLIENRELPPPKWQYTDDTAMALSIVDLLVDAGLLEESALSSAFALRYTEEPNRGYGGGAHQILSLLAKGSAWNIAATTPFGPNGSFGNGAAMRVAPLGAYFAEDVDALIAQATISARVTHLHPEGIAGAIAVALAAAYAWNTRPQSSTGVSEPMISYVVARLPESEVRAGLIKGASIPCTTESRMVAKTLGSGDEVSAVDTVPFCLWVASHYQHSYEEAMWQTVSGLGDRDTTCAIVGGIVSLTVGVKGIPEKWLISREGLSLKYNPYGS